MPNGWIPATKWTTLKNKQEADQKIAEHRAKPWFAKDFLLEVCHNAGEWFARYSVRRIDFREPNPIDPDQFTFGSMDFSKGKDYA